MEASGGGARGRPTGKSLVEYTPKKDIAVSAHSFCVAVHEMRGFPCRGMAGIRESNTKVIIRSQVT